MEQIKSIILNNKEYKITENSLRQLSAFLKHIKHVLKNDEKYSDIEIQMSILLDMELEQKKEQIITSKILNEAINVMKENQKIKYKQQFYSNERFKRKTKTKQSKNPLKRNMSKKILGGVCSGIARKLGIDPVLIRILFLLLALFRGLFIPVYILLWIVIPADELNSKYKNTVSI